MWLWVPSPALGDPKGSAEDETSQEAIADVYNPNGDGLDQKWKDVPGGTVSWQDLVTGITG